MGQKCGLDPVLLWLWGRLAATPPIRHLPRELPYAAGVALKKKKKKKRQNQTKNNRQLTECLLVLCVPLLHEERLMSVCGS